MLKEKLQSDAKEALKQSNQLVLGVLRMALSAIGAKEKEKRYKISKDSPKATDQELIKKSHLEDDEIIAILSSEVKKRKDAVALYQKGGRPELAENEQKEIEILQKYLPEQIPLDQLSKMIQEAIKETGAETQKDMGRLMTSLSVKIKGRADNKEVSKIIKELLH